MLELSNAGNTAAQQEYTRRIVAQQVGQQEQARQYQQMIAGQLLARRHSPNGIEFFAEYGAMRVSRYMDGTAQMLLASYRKVGASFAGIA